MKDEMIIDGEKLALYLQKCNVGKREFLEAINLSEPFLLDDEMAFEIEDCLSMDLFKKKARVGYESSIKMIKHLGADVAAKIIDWEAMGFEQDDRIAVEELLAILGYISYYNANKSQAI